MSVILFKCDSERKEEVKTKFWDILHDHYSHSVYPNTHVKYEHEGDDIYAQRLDELMKESLCKCEDTKDGLRFEFDSTEDAGFNIAALVYRTNMGYSDDGLTFLKPLFEDLIEKLPDVCFEADCVCEDRWVCEEYHCSYDGETFETDAEWDEFEE